MEAVELNRGCDAIEIPSGRVFTLPAGTKVRVMQSLGDTYTVLTDAGYMARVAQEDADALGLEVKSTLASIDDDRSLDERVWDVLRTCYDPEIPVNIVDLGLVYHCQVHPMDEGGNRVEIRLTLTAPGCGMGDVLRADVQRKLVRLRGVSYADVEVVFDPPWDRSRMSEAAMLQLGMF